MGAATAEASNGVGTAGCGEVRDAGAAELDDGVDVGRIAVLLGAEHEEEHHPADRGDQDPADQPVDEHRSNGGRQRHAAVGTL
jgi:hypothetical protein